MKKLTEKLQALTKEIKDINKSYSTTIGCRTQNPYLSQLRQILGQVESLIEVDFRASREEDTGYIGVPYEFIAKDDIIDLFIVYNSFDLEKIIIPQSNTTLYPLAFPYWGARGPRREIEQIFIDNLGKTALGVIPFVLGNEPLSIRPWKFERNTILTPSGDLDGGGTLIGIIDTGIDYTNPAFINLDGKTRITSIWDQTIGNQSPYGYGSVYDKEMINKALQNADPFEIVPHKDEWGHGTILAGIAAGAANYEEGSYKGIATGAELVIVKLKPANDPHQTLFHGSSNPLGFSALDVALAIEFMANVANISQRPISICLPMGTNSGPHDGTNVLDSIISRYSSNPGIAMVLSVGDEANKNHHAAGDLKDEREQEIKLVIAQGQKSFIGEIWAGFGDRIDVLLTAPKSVGENLQAIMLNKSQQYVLSETSSVWSEGIKFDNDTGCQRIRFRFDNPISGEWIIRVRGIVVVEGHYNIWIPKTGMILPGTVFLPDDPFTTLFNTSTAVGVIAIGCYDPKSQSACTSSGRGFTRDNRPSPDYIVDGTEIPGPLPANEWGIISGTAPASAITVGITSLVYQNQVIQGEELANTIVMKAILADKVMRQSTVLYPNPSSGYGVLDLS